MARKSKAAEVPREGVNTRITKDLRERLEASASAAGRSVGSEIERRLERSFLFKEELLALFEDDKTFSAVCAVAMTWISLESVIGRPWYSDKDTLDVAKSSAASIISAFKTTSPDPSYRGNADIDEKTKALKRQQFGDLLSGQVQIMARNRPVGADLDKALHALGGDLFGGPPVED